MVTKRSTSKGKGRKAAAPKASKKKVLKRKTTAKKVTTRKPAAKKVVKKDLKLTAVKKSHTKTQIQKLIAEHVGITKKQVSEVFDSLSKVVHAHLKTGACGSISIEGLLKITKARKPAKKARKGINPFTGEPMTFKAKPAHNVIKVKALKKLKEMSQHLSLPDTTATLSSPDLTGGSISQRQ